MADNVSRPNEEEEKTEEKPVPASFMSYPVSTLSPKIVPTDLTSFKSKGITKVQKDAAHKLQDLKEQYEQIVEDFNWNKLVYESRFNFEPVIGETYHLYREADHFRLSLIEPERWPQKRYVGSFELRSSGNWKVIRKAPDFDLREFLSNEEENEPV
jgi:hypothetical protein